MSSLTNGAISPIDMSREDGLDGLLTLQEVLVIKTDSDFPSYLKIRDLSEWN